MKREWLQYLGDPHDLSPLQFEGDIEERDGRVVTATLVSASGRRYPVRQGIPVFVAPEFQAKESVASFAYEWNEFGFDFAKEGWLGDICRPLVGDQRFFEGKLCVDAGAGSGAQTRWMAEGGAKLIFSLDLSDALFDRHKNTIEPYRDRVFPIQCDIAYPPLRQKVDVLYCINVIQHTADPRVTFRQLVQRLLAPGGVFLFNIYGKRSEKTYQAVMAVRRVIRPLPFSVWKALSWAITCVSWPLYQIRPLRPLLRKAFPMSHSFKESWLDLYDVYGGHWYQENMREDDQLKMIESEGLAILRKTHYGYLLTPRAAPAAMPVLSD